MSADKLSTYKSLCTNLQKVIRGQDETIRKLVAVLIGGGHVLLEDYPGTANTTLSCSTTICVNVSASI